MKKTLLVLLSVAGAVGLASVQAQLINVDFNGNSVGSQTQWGSGWGGGFGPTQSGAALIGGPSDSWNGITDAAMGFTDNTTGVTGPINSGPLALNYANGSASGVTMVVNAGGSYDANEPGWNNHSPFTTAASPYSNLMEDEIFSTPLATLTLSGLAPLQSYALVIYSAGDQNLQINGDPTVYTSKVGTFTVNGVTQTTTWYGTQNTLIAGQTYVQFAATSDANGNLVINYGGTPINQAAGINPETDFSGFQLVPEPSTLALLASGAVLLLGYQRRKALRA